MIGFVLNLAVLSAMLALISALALVFRRFVLRSKEGMMYPVWLLVLLISITPIRVDPAVFIPCGISLSDDAVEFSGSRVEPTEALPSEIDSLASDDGQPYAAAADNERSITDSAAKFSPESLFTVRMRRIVSGFGARLGQICSLLFALWISGMMIHFTLSTADYLQAKRLLDLSSVECRNRRINAMLADCKKQLGVRIPVRLRMLETESLCSPCVCGCIYPTIYLEPGCRKLSDAGLRCVIAHELCHIRRGDMLLKLFSIFVTSVHWFNPISRVVLAKIHEDCELACDRSVISAFGKRVSGVYMSAILDFAERFSQKGRMLGADSFGGGLFMSESGGVSFLKRRYANMKSFRSEKLASAAACTFIAVCAAVNILALSSCSGFNPGHFSLAKQLDEPLEQMVRAYYGLSEDDFITPDMLDGITSLEITANTTHEGTILADFTVNGEYGYAMAVPRLALQNYWDSCIDPYIREAADSVDETSYLSDTGKLITAVFDDKIFAFYCLKDPYDSRLTERAVQEMKLTYPVLLEKGSLYIFDPFSSEREIKAIYGCFDMAGLLDVWAINSDRFDASSLAYFSNLSEVTFNGFTPVNYRFPDTIKVVVNGEEVTDGRYLSTEKVYNYAIPTDGSTIVSLENQSLDAAIREYFGISNEYFDTVSLTSRECDRISSVKAVRDVELTEILRNEGGGLFDKAIAVRYTINGRALPILPQYVAQADFDRLISGGITDSEMLELYMSLYEYSSDGYKGYVLKADADDRSQKTLFGYFAREVLARVALIGTHDCGAYLTQFTDKTARATGLAARLVDCADSFDSGDRDLLANLEAWEIELE